MTTTCDSAGVLARGRPATPDALRWRADWLRLEVIRVIDGAGLGHYSSTFSCAEILSVLYYRTMRLNPGDPNWPDRDRFLFGKGHAAVGQWPILADLGYFPAAYLEQFGKIGSPLGDHPDMRKAPGCDFSSGSLGHNLSVGVGMSLAARLRGSDHRTFVLTGDGELHEGQVWEAAMAATHHRLGNLVAIVDANGYCASGQTSSIMNIEPIGGRFAAFGWLVREIDGNDVDALVDVLDNLPAADSPQPVCIVARTTKGKGLAVMEEAPRAWHIGCLSRTEREQAVAEISARMQGWSA
jgi:transketolase